MLKLPILLSIAITLVALGCGFAKPIATPLPIPTPLTSLAGETKIIQATILNFRQQSLTIEVGSVVEWTNLDSVVHTVSHAPVTGLPRAFDSGRLEDGQQVRVLFDTPGDFFYICQIHSTQMTATITVVPTGES